MKILMFSSDPKALSRIRKYEEVAGKIDAIMLDRSKGRFLRFWKGYREAKKLLKAERYDLITAQEIEHSFLAWRLSKKFKVPFQMQIHTDIFSPHFVGSRVSNIFNRVRVMLAKFLIPRASCVRVVSERIKKSLSNLTKSDFVRVLPIFTEVKFGGVNPHTKDFGVGVNLRQKYKDYDFIILMVSRLTKEKNIPLALDVMKKIAKRYPGTLLAIVGDGPEREALKSQVSSFKLEDNIKFEGWQENISGYYQTSDCLLLTSDYEGYGLSVIEALQNGLPVVMTDVGVAGEIIKNGGNGLVVPVRDKDAIIGAIVELQMSPDFRKELSENARKTTVSYNSFEEYREKLVNSWKQCLLR
jgi:glycosyltransferase involved in cell wall biosynthesis